METAIKHYLLKKKVTRDTKARGDFMYDEGMAGRSAIKSHADTC